MDLEKTSVVSITFPDLVIHRCTLGRFVKLNDSRGCLILLPWRLHDLGQSSERSEVLNEIKIDTATEADLPSIRLLLQELIDAMTNTKGFDAEQSIENCRILIKDPAHHMFVARDKNNILGFVNITIRKTIIHPRPSGLIDELIVSRGSRSLGIGKQLILAAINKCRALGCCEVEVSTEKSNIKARRFYKTCGFEEDAVLLEIHLEECSDQ